MKASSIFLPVCLAWLVGPVSGQNSLSWTNDTIGKFSDPNNWGEIVLNGQFVHVTPKASDNVFFTVLLGAVNGRSYTVILNAGDAARNTTLGGGVVFDVEGAANLGETILSADQLTVTGPGTLTTSPLNHSGVLNIAGGKVTTSRLEFSSGPADVIVTGGGRFTSDTTASQRIATGSALVVGGGSLWKNTGLLKMVDATMRGGGQITADIVTNGTLLVDGPGSAFTTFGHLEIHVLTVTNSGRIYNDTANLGSVGHVDGASSVWTINDTVTMDAGAALTIQNGGQVQAATFHADSSVLVTGPSSKLLLSRDLSAGTTEISDGKVEVNKGGYMQSSSGFVGGKATAIVTVHDPNSAWAVLGKGLSVGDQLGGVLSVLTGGRVSVANNSVFGIGTEPTGSGIVEINDTGSVLDAFQVNVGREGNGTLRVQSGGRMLSKRVTVGALAGSQGNVIVAGNPSSFEVANAIIVGAQGQGQLTLSAAGFVRTDSLSIGQSSSSNVVTVTGGESTLIVTNELFVGDGGFGKLNVMTSGKVFVTDTNSNFGVSAKPGSIGLVLVDGKGSELHAAGAAIVGGFAPGTLSVRNSGLADFDIAAIGLDKRTSTLIVDGSGSQLRVRDKLFVGGENSVFGSGLLVVTNQGFAQVDRKLTLFPAGVVWLQGGSLNVGTLAQVPPPNILRVSAGGILSGKGRVIGKTLVGLGGKLAPGLSDGTFTADGDYEQEAGAELSLNVGGPEPDAGYDVLNVTGNVTLAGKLTLNFINGFAPKANQVFEFLKFGTNLVGNFTQVEITGLAPDFQYEVKQLGAGSFGLVALNEGIPTSPPPLSIERVGVDLLVSWPANAQSFGLQSSTNLGSTNWIDLITTANQLSIPSTNSMKFFRLIKR